MNSSLDHQDFILELEENCFWNFRTLTLFKLYTLNNTNGVWRGVPEIVINGDDKEERNMDDGFSGILLNSEF